METTPQKQEVMPNFGIFPEYSPLFHIQNKKGRSLAGKGPTVSYLVSTENEYFQNIPRMAILMLKLLWKAIHQR